MQNRSDRGVVHGLFWKIVALAAKAGFLIVVAPTLPAGEFSGYVFLSTAALLAGRFLSCGASDQLVLEIRGRQDEARRYMALYGFLLALSFILSLSALWAGDGWRAAALAMTIVASSVLEGAVRSCAPSQYERLTNFAPIMFLAMCAFLEPDSASTLVSMFTFATIAAQVIVVASSGMRPSDWRSSHVSVTALRGIASRGFGKMVAEFTLVADIRGVLLWPKLISGKLASDSLAFAVTIAEAVSTLLMVVVNRNYARYSAVSGPSPPPLKSAGFAIAAMALLASGMFFLPLVSAVISLPILDRVSAVELAWSLVYLGAVTAYYDLRYHAWSQGARSWRFSAVQVLFFAGQGVVVWSLDPSLHVVAVGVAAVLAVGAWIVLLRRQ